MQDRSRQYSEDRGISNMKKKLNTVFFGLFFLGSVVAETYFIQTSSGDYISVVGIGIVLLISGYLLMDSVRSKLAEQGKGIKSYVERMYQDETRQRNQQLTELINLQKATYSATKKNTAAITAQLEALLERVTVLEENHGKALERLEILQKKSLEGQKNALNLEINYSKEHTKQLMRVLREVGDQAETRELLHKIVEYIDKGTAELQKELQNISIVVPSFPGNEEPVKDAEQDWKLEDSSWGSYASGQSSEEHKIKNQASADWEENQAMESSLADIMMEVESEDIMMESSLADIMMEAEPEDVMMEVQPEDVMIEASPEDSMMEAQTEHVMMEAPAEDFMPEAFIKSTSWLQEEKTPDTITSGQEEPISEADAAIEAIAVTAAEQVPASIPEIIPLYDDPNKTLSADEIARLFASLGR